MIEPAPLGHRGTTRFLLDDEERDDFDPDGLRFRLDGEGLEVRLTPESYGAPPRHRHRTESCRRTAAKRPTPKR
ncbi:hypothetical protein [Amycolatopsis albispora]|uniref:hypothetical protein n=1 Tax=Amycolatopsis albispora TaxID=1804986 RepID=UPI0013B3F01A|nr:hypothetical protein [Amycolatopsis albispora]